MVKMSNTGVINRQYKNPALQNDCEGRGLVVGTIPADISRTRTLLYRQDP